MVFRANAYGLACVCISYGCIGYTDYAVTVHMIGGSLTYSAWGMVNIFFFNVILGLLVISHIRSMTNDPGLVPLNFTHTELSHINEEGDGNGWTVCSKCQVERPKNTYHCRICNRCVRKVIHHCPWINNCIGEFNLKYVFMTIFYVVLAGIFTFTMIVTYWVLHPPYITEKQKHAKEWHITVLSLIALGFSLFSVAVGYDLIAALREGDDLDNDPKEQTTHETSNLKASLYEVFHAGGLPQYAVDGSRIPHPILWLFPIEFGPRRAKSRSLDFARQPLLS